MATNIEQIFRSFVVSKFREIQEEQQQHSGGKVEGQPNGDTIPAEQANPSDDTVAGAGSRQNDQIVQKIEEVLSGALDTELQCKSDKNTVKNSTKSTKRSSTAEDEIPRKKSKKNKKHKSKKKKKKKKKRKKEKKHKKQPKESKLTKIQALEAVLQPGTLGVARGLGGNVCSEAKMGSKVLEASPGLLALEERSQRTHESVAACVSMEPVRESETLAGMMHFKTTAERESKHGETVAEPVGASKTESSIISQSQVMTCTGTSQTEVLGEITDSELATSSATV
ncbi:SON protein, partial [Syrrhaptes paradoxus]|nr:SON protein [Syrrhaptes paradoxus]